MSQLRAVAHCTAPTGARCTGHGDLICTEPATTADLVAALIAEGGETIWWCETHGCQGVTGLGGAGRWCICVNVGLTGETIEDREQEASKQGCRMVEKLLVPIPVESAEANGESPEVPT